MTKTTKRPGGDADAKDIVSSALNSSEKIPNSGTAHSQAENQGDAGNPAVVAPSMFDPNIINIRFSPDRFWLITLQDTQTGVEVTVHVPPGPGKGRGIDHLFRHDKIARSMKKQTGIGWCRWANRWSPARRRV